MFEVFLVLQHSTYCKLWNVYFYIVEWKQMCAFNMFTFITRGTSSPFTPIGSALLRSKFWWARTNFIFASFQPAVQHRRGQWCLEYMPFKRSTGDQVITWRKRWRFAKLSTDICCRLSCKCYRMLYFKNLSYTLYTTQLCCWAELRWSWSAVLLQ